MEGRGLRLGDERGRISNSGSPIWRWIPIDAYERALPREVGTSLVMQGKTEAGMQGKNRCTAAVGDLVVFLDGRK
jgi:hypothetical protein